MQKSVETRNRLSFRILRWVLLVALISGIVLSAVQIIIDARRVSDQLDNQAEQTLALVRDSATQAVYSIDPDLAQQVVDGLFKQQSVRYARISHPDGDALAERARPMRPTAFRPITDHIFGAGRIYRARLTRSNDDPTTYGFLQVHYDTSYAAESWMERATVTFLNGIVRALVLGLVLYLVFHILLTRALIRIIKSLARVNPDNPGDTLLEVPKGHDKDELGLWITATNNLLVAITQNQQKQAAAEARVSELSHYDKLTGLPNREKLLEILGGLLEQQHRHGQSLAVYVCGLDDFKSVNELNGYHLGDKLLKTLGDRLSQSGPNGALIAARLGSDQFVVVESHLRDGYQCATTSEWLLQQMSRTVELGASEVSITTTIGIALYPDDADDTEQLLQRAEQTMTLAKTTGRNQFQFYVASVDEAIRNRRQLEKDLQRALPEKQFHLVYQPQINLESGRIVGAEALIRWEHPENGLVPPDHFIPLAEVNGVIREIGAWVLDEACAQAAQWALQGIPIRIAVNLSAIQLHQDNIVDIVLDTLKRHDLPPGRLELEVTETGFMENLDSAVEKLNELRNHGIYVAVDDFGTGYSSLTYLKRLPVQHLKIDKQFISDLLVNEGGTRIANTIIDLGRSLNLSVVAEGVETEEQQVYLLNRGCQMAQGYYFSKPVKPEVFEEYYHEFHRQLTADNSD